MVHSNLGNNAQLELMANLQRHMRNIGQLIAMQPNLFGHLRIVGLSQLQEGRLQTVCIAQQMVLMRHHEYHFRVHVTGTGQIGGSFGGQQIVAGLSERIFLQQSDADFGVLTLELYYSKHT